MSDNKQEHSQILIDIRESFDDAREATKGVGKTAALWTAALIVIWISSLEPTWRTVAKSTRAFREINMSRQEAESRAVTRLRRFAIEEEELKPLEKLAQKYPLGQERDQERNRRERSYNDLKEKSNTVKKSSGKESTQYDEAKTAEAIADQKLQQFKSLDNLLARKARLESEKSELAKEPERLKNAYVEARKQAQANERNVSFDLFGLKFNAPTLLAPLLWCFLCSALLGYLTRARAKCLTYCENGLHKLVNSPDFSEDDMQDLAKRLPVWTIRSGLITNSSLLRPEEDRDMLVRHDLVARVFSSHTEQLLVPFLAFLIPFLTLAAEFRVGWIALELSRHVGSNWARSLVPVVLVSIVLSSIWIGIQWVTSPQSYTSQVRKKNFCIIVISVTSIISIAFATVRNPSLGILFGYLVQQAIPWAGVLLGLIVVGLSIYRVYNRRLHDWISSVSYSRRRAIKTISGFVILSILTLALPTFLRKFTRKRKRNQKHIPKNVGLGQGFYENKISFKKPAFKVRKTNRRVTVVHYVGLNGMISNRGSFPNIQKISKTKPPIWNSHFVESIYLSMTSNTEQSAPLRIVATTSFNAVDIDLSKQDRLIFGHSASVIGNPSLSLVHPSTRVHLSTASWSFEQAALAILHSGRIGRKKSAYVCDLLFSGILHDLQYKQLVNNQRKKERPSFRLYDLLAGISIRYSQRGYFQQLIELIELSGQRLAFQTRIEKWQNPSSSWWQKWKNRDKPISWRGNSDAVVF